MKKSDVIKKTIFISLTQILLKVTLFLSAYILSKEGYFFFNKFYYTASLVILWSSFGFDIGVHHSKTKNSLLVPAVVFNIMIVSVVMGITGEYIFKNANWIAIAAYSFAVVVSGVFSLRLIFRDKININLLITFLNSILMLGSIYLLRIGKEEIFIICFPLSSMMVMFLYYYVSAKDSKINFVQNNLGKLYQCGLLSFSINGIVPLVFSADKFIINHYFNSAIANSYTFSWGLIAPIFYIGNIVEKVIYSSSEREERNIVYQGFWLMVLSVSTYSLIVLTVIKVFPNALPRSLDISLVKDISIWMMLGYSIYAFFQFPINALLFKYRGVHSQKKVAYKYVVVIGFVIITFLLLKEFILGSYLRLLVFNLMVVYLLLIIKWFETDPLSKKWKKVD